MASTWVADEMWTVDLKDRRLNKRLREVLSQLGGQPTAGIVLHEMVSRGAAQDRSPRRQPWE